MPTCFSDLIFHKESFVRKIIGEFQSRNLVFLHCRGFATWIIPFDGKKDVICHKLFVTIGRPDNGKKLHISPVAQRGKFGNIQKPNLFSYFSKIFESKKKKYQCDSIVLHKFFYHSLFFSASAIMEAVRGYHLSPY